MHLLASFTKQRLQCCLLAVCMASNQLLRGLFPFPLCIYTIYMYLCYSLVVVTPALVLQLLNVFLFEYVYANYIMV